MRQVIYAVFPYRMHDRAQPERERETRSAIPHYI